jgi:hypothetical protein
MESASATLDLLRLMECAVSVLLALFITPRLKTVRSVFLVVSHALMELLVPLAYPIIYSPRLLDTAHRFVAQIKQSSTGHANALTTLSE